MNGPMRIADLQNLSPRETAAIADLAQLANSTAPPLERRPALIPRSIGRGSCGGTCPLPGSKHWLPHDGEAARKRRLKQLARIELKVLKAQFGVAVSETNGELITESGLVLPTRAR